MYVSECDCLCVCMYVCIYVMLSVGEWGNEEIIIVYLNMYYIHTAIKQA